MDINELSFSIQGEARGASESIATLIKRLDTLDSAFTRASASGTGFVNVLNALRGAAAGTGEAFSSTAKTAKTAKTAFEGVKKATEKTKTAVDQTTASTNKMTQSVEKADKKSSAWGSSLGNLIKRITQVSFLVYTLKKATDIFSKAIRTSIGYVENLNLFMVALGENTGRATSFIKEMSESLYIDEAKLTRVQGLFFQISESLGLGSEKAYILSENFTKLAFDLASFYDISSDAAVTKLQAGLVGETEPLRRLGIIITENNLAETARNLGIKKSIRNMTEQEKIQLRYITALQQTQNAHGDLARTLKEPENLLKTLNEQVSIFWRELGNAAIPVIRKFIPELIGMVRAVTSFVKEWALFMGYEPPEIRDDLGGHMKTVAKAADDVSKSTDKTVKNLAKVLKYTRETSNAMTGIDELNILGGSMGENITPVFTTDEATKSVALLDLALKAYNNLMDVSKGMFDDVTEKWKEKFVTLKNIILDVTQYTRTALKEASELLFGSGELGAWDALVAALRLADAILGGIITGVVTFIEKVNEVITGVNRLFGLNLPAFLESLMEGDNSNIVKAVSAFTVLFLTMKTITISQKALTFLSGLLGLSQSTTLLGILGALAAVKIGVDFKNAIDEDAINEWGAKMALALAGGLTVGGLTGSLKAGVIVFGIIATLDFDADALIKKSMDMGRKMRASIYKAMQEGITEPLDILINAIIDPINALLEGINFFRKESNKIPLIPYSDISGKVNIMIDNLMLTDVPGTGAYNRPEAEAVRKIKEDSENLPVVTWEQLVDYDKTQPAISPLVTGQPIVSFEDYYLKNIKRYAKGGRPAKGSLFIAGEEGPELVADFGDGTSVVNEQQMRGLGIPMAADGWNVPSAEKATESFNAFFNLIPNAIKKQKEKKGKVDATEKETTKRGAEVVEWMKNFIKTFKAYDEAISKGLKNTDLIKGLTSAYEQFKKALTDGNTILGKTVQGMASVGKMSGKLVVQAFSAFKEDKGIRQIFSQKASDGGTTQQQQEVTASMLSNVLGDTGKLIFSLLNSVADGTLGEFVNSLPLFVEAGLDMLLNLMDGILKALPSLLASLPSVIKKIADLFTDGTTIKTLVSGLIDMVVVIVTYLPSIIMALVEAIPSIIMSLIEALVANAGKFIGVGVILASSIVEGLVNTIISGINWLIKQINKIPFVNIPLLNSVSWTESLAKKMGYAEGGFPPQGQMFIAREAGAELVGNIGGRTAVANNDQIVEAVSDGVYRAVSQAMREQGDKPLVVNLDGRRVSESLGQASKNRGLLFGTGGY